MASMRSGTRLFRFINNSRVGVRNLSKKQAGTGYAAFRPVLLGSIAVGTGSYLAYEAYKSKNELITPLNVAHAASSAEPQPSVVTQTKSHALYLWIHLKPTADVKACAKTAAKLQDLVNAVTPPKEADDDTEIWAGVGFGPNFYAQVSGKTKKNYNYPHRKGALGDMPSSGGEIFVHAKSDSNSKLFELAHKFISSLPKDSVANYEDIYSWVYKNGRDLSGFIDGTENPADDEHRTRVAVEPETGGSYVITQKWVHNLDVINSEKDKTLESWVGRRKEDSVELSRKSISSHVARMTGGNNFEQKKVFEIVRQSMPFGSLSGKAGLFFIGYAASPEQHEYMLDRMVGAGGDGHSDDIMRLSDCVKGTYWYFPGAAELKKL